MNENFEDSFSNQKQLVNFIRIMEADVLVVVWQLTKNK